MSTWFYQLELFWKPIQMISLAKVDPLRNVHIFYQDWVKSVQNNQYSEFMDLWETCMIHSTSEAIFETATLKE